MGCKRNQGCEGIRFLDETPEPTIGNPAQATAPKNRKKKEWPVGLMTFLAVVTGGILWKAAQEDRVVAREVFEERIQVEPAPRIEVEALQGSVRIRRGADRLVVCQVEAEGRGDSDEQARWSVRMRKPLIRSGSDGVSVRVGAPEEGAKGLW